MCCRRGAQQGVGVHRTFQAVHVEVAFAQGHITAKGGCDQGEQLLLPRHQRREAQAVHIARPYADELVGAQFGRNVHGTVQVDDEGVRKFRCLFRKRVAVQQPVRQQGGQLLHSCVVPRDADVQRSWPHFELDPRQGPHLVFVRQPEQVAPARRAVDVGERHLLKPQVVHLLQHLLGREHAVVEAEPAVDVEEHGS